MKETNYLSNSLGKEKKKKKRGGGLLHHHDASYVRHRIVMD